MGPSKLPFISSGVLGVCFEYGVMLELRSVLLMAVFFIVMAQLDILGKEQ